MSDHSSNYWSIGEVLSLLQDSFPEVTISKIRFLESQGLIDPERTPSGYRRFYQLDFDRLQWILTQQRDHYLPLKVIRDRLDAGEWERPEHPDEPAAPRTGQMNLLAPVIDIRNGEPASQNPASGDTGATGEPADRPQTGGAAPGSETSSPSASAGSEAPVGDAAENTAPDSTASDNAASDSTASDNTSESASVAVEQRDPAEVPATKAMEPVDSGIALTLDEMASASGCDVAMIRELERFKLIAGRTMGPTVLYDGEALTIARHAAQFRNFGLDPRHLRTFRVGAEREVALLAQVVEPLRHRRDPETRRKSVETMDDLLDLGASLRAILMRQITREQLPPA